MRYVCRVCAPRAPALVAHTDAAHTGGKPFTCRCCGVDFATLNDLFAQARDAVSLELAKPSDADRRFDLGFTTPDATPIYVDAKRTAVVHANNLQKVCDLKKGQRHAVEAGDKAKSYSYQKAISNFDDKRRHIFLALTPAAT